MNPLRKKLFSDIRLEKGRLALSWLALIVSLVGTFVMLNSYSVLNREIARNYELTTPAHATFEIESVSEELVRAARNHPEVAAAERRRSVALRAKVNGEWRRVRLFVIDDFEELHLNRFTLEKGSWATGAGEILLERSALRLSDCEIGDPIELKFPNRPLGRVVASGLVHDAGLSPSDQERTLFAYVGADTFERVAGEARFDELMVRYADTDPSREEIVASSQSLGEWLSSQGATPHEIRVPPPKRHPHQGPLEAVLKSFIGFGFLSLGLSGILIATSLNALLAKQTRQIAVIKAIGATPRQIARLYRGLMFTIGAGSVAVAFPLALLAARPFSEMIAELINFELYESGVPASIIAFQIVVGLLLPWVFSVGIVKQAAFRSVRSGLDDSNASPRFVGMAKWLRSVARKPVSLLIACNLLSRPKRLALILAMISFGGAVFMSSFNMRSSWTQMVGRVHTDRDYHVELLLNQPYALSELQAVTEQSPEVDFAEAWFSLAAYYEKKGTFPVVSTYPDGGHGSFTLHAIPAATRVVAFPVVEGRWIQEGDVNAVVLNQSASRKGMRLGDSLVLDAEGHAVRGQVVGFVEEVGSAAAAYVSLQALPETVRLPDHFNRLRIKLKPIAARDRNQAILDLETRFAQAGIQISGGMPLAELQTAMNAHIGVLLISLLIAALAIAAVAGFGICSLFGVSVIERQSEISTLRSLGFAPRSITRMLMLEGALLSLLSVVGSILLSLAISGLLNRIVGDAAFQLSLPLRLSLSGTLAWILGAFAIVGTACYLPAKQFERMKAVELRRA